MGSPIRYSPYDHGASDSEENRDWALTKENKNHYFEAAAGLKVFSIFSLHNPWIVNYLYTNPNFRGLVERDLKLNGIWKD